MARIALIKLFSGLNMGVAQLTAELLRAGHAAHIYHFKKMYMKPKGETEGMLGGEDIVTTNGKEMVWLLYYPFTDEEYETLREELRRFNPDAIGLTVVGNEAERCAELSRELRKGLSSPIIWGGLGPTLEPEKCIPHADLIVINEGEETIVEIANRLDAGQPLNDIAGTWYRDEKGVVRNPNRPVLDLNSIAMPCWDKAYHSFIDNNRIVHNYRPRNMKVEYPIMTQRGCPFSCAFCVESRVQELFGKKGSLRRRDPELVLEELHWAKKNIGLKKVLFYDEVFTVNPRWLKDFLPRYKREIDVPFWCYTYPTTHNPEMLKLMKDNGCVSVGMGVQTGSERLLKEHYNRPTELKRVIEAAQEIVDAGLEGTFDLITRGPFDTEYDLRATFELLLDFPKELQCLGFGYMSLIPTFSLTRQAEKAGLITSDNTNYTLPLTTETYDYYHKLYLLTRTSMKREKLLAIADDPRFRENQDLFTPYIEEYVYNRDKKETFWGRDWIV